MIDLHLDRRFSFLQFVRSFLQLKSRCRETTEDDVIASWNDDVRARNPGSPWRNVLAFRENKRWRYSTVNYEHRSVVLRERM